MVSLGVQPIAVEETVSQRRRKVNERTNERIARRRVSLIGSFIHFFLAEVSTWIDRADQSELVFGLNDIQCVVDHLDRVREHDSIIPRRCHRPERLHRSETIRLLS
jgi:hypothetical protein